MSLEYPCVYHENGKCKKFSDEESISFCIYGPCKYQTPSNGDRIRAMSDKELAVWLYEEQKVTVMSFSKGICDRFGIQNPLETFYPDHTGNFLIWLQQPAESEDKGEPV